MATALTADAMLAALTKWGITPSFYRPDWRTHNRNAAQGWGPIEGFAVHNFGSDTSDPNSLAYLYRGDTARGMPGPLSQFAITDDGTVWVIGWGAANHTGSMSRALRDLVLKDAAPLGGDFKPGVRAGDAGSVSGVNDNYIGVEMTYGKAPTAAQRASVVRLAAALMDALGAGYTGGSVIGHRECTVDRSDPVGFPMGQFRKDVNALLAAGPGRATQAAPARPAPTPAPATDPTELDMKLTDKVPGQDYTLAQALARGNWAYQQSIEGGSIDRRIDALTAGFNAVTEALRADDKVTAERILERLQVELSVKPETPDPVQ